MIQCETDSPKSFLENTMKIVADNILIRIPIFIKSNYINNFFRQIIFA